jgi:hypothetical protein
VRRAGAPAKLIQGTNRGRIKTKAASYLEDVLDEALEDVLEPVEVSRGVKRLPQRRVPVWWLWCANENCSITMYSWAGRLSFLAQTLVCPQSEAALDCSGGGARPDGGIGEVLA